MTTDAGEAAIRNVIAAAIAGHGEAIGRGAEFERQLRGLCRVSTDRRTRHSKRHDLPYHVQPTERRALRHCSLMISKQIDYPVKCRW
jgi:hypothetical protein